MNKNFFENYIGNKNDYAILKQIGGKNSDLPDDTKGQKSDLPNDTKKHGVSEEKSLYDRLGGIYAISAVVDHFSDAILDNDMVGRNSSNPQLKEWFTKEAETRLPGLKGMRSLWMCEATGGPCKFFPSEKHQNSTDVDNMDLSEPHRKLRISPEEFDEVAKILKQTLIHFKVPEREMGEVLAAFAAHKEQVTKGFFEALQNQQNPKINKQSEK